MASGVWYLATARCKPASPGKPRLTEAESSPRIRVAPGYTGSPSEASLTSPFLLTSMPPKGVLIETAFLVVPSSLTLTWTPWAMKRRLAQTASTHTITINARLRSTMGTILLPARGGTGAMGARGTGDEVLIGTFLE